MRLVILYFSWNKFLLSIPVERMTSTPKKGRRSSSSSSSSSSSPSFIVNLIHHSGLSTSGSAPSFLFPATKTCELCSFVCCSILAVDSSRCRVASVIRGLLVAVPPLFFLMNSASSVDHIFQHVRKLPILFMISSFFRTRHAVPSHSSYPILSMKLVADSYDLRQTVFWEDRHGFRIKKMRESILLPIPIVELLSRVVTSKTPSTGITDFNLHCLIIPCLSK
ncbi:unnamed protein product [Protopolystoma xenopodis]|uniref:Uncharacterized protein n=1 Tax=Protopolystoma xenopodis TaxID=117903 RepID=A0A3S5CNC2_9PLAT|nr:unnamed protein product [Protopolystoma xenopodis]